MADLNYVSPLTSDLTDYYTKTEVDELQQGDENKFATQAQITAGDNEVKGWVASQGFLTQHQSLANYATKEYVNDAIEDIQIEGGVRISIVGSLPLEPEENVIYLTRKSETDTDNIYNEWIWVPAIEDFELIGDTTTGVIPDLTEYATKTWVQLQGYLTSVSADEIAFNNQASGLDSTNVEDAIGEVNGRLRHFTMTDDLAPVALTGDWDDLVNRPSIPSSTVAFSGDYADLLNKPVIPSLAGYATTNYVDTAVGAIVVPDVSGLASEQYVDNAVAAIDIPDVTGFVESSDLAAVATSGSYNDLTNKPTIPSTVGLATETYVNNAIAAIDIPDISGLASETYVDAEIANIDIPDVSDFITERQATSIAAGEAAGAVSNFENTLATVATSGDYDDLTNKPTIPSLSGYATETWVGQQGYLTQHQDISGKANSADLATVATSGSYNDLLNKPTIPNAGLERVYAPFIITPEASWQIANYNLKVTVNTIAEAKEKLAQGLWVYFNGFSGTLSITDIGGESNETFQYYTYNGDKTYAQIIGVSSLNISAGSTIGIVAPKTVVIYPNSVVFPMDLFKHTAGNVVYSNTTSGLTATTVQAALDELAAASGSSSGITVQDVIDEFNENGLVIDNGTDNKIEITNGGISKTGYTGGTEEGVVWSVDKYVDIDETQLLFGKDVVNDDVQTSEMSLKISPSRNYDAIEVEMTDTGNDYNDTKTIAFVEDLPSAVKYVYDSTNKRLTFMGVPEDDI